MAEHENSAALDALLAAITDEPLPEGAHDDPEFATEHRAAVADVALLREQLTLLGDALAQPAAEAKPVRAPKRRARRPAGAPRTRSRRPLAVAMGTLVAVAFAAVVVGMGWLIAQNGIGGASEDSGSSAAKATDHDEKKGGSSLSAPGYLACARLVVEGTVARVERLGDGSQSRITLDVSRYYKPEKGADQVDFLMLEDVQPHLSKGQHVLIGIPEGVSRPDIWTVGEKEIARERAWISKALPQSKGLKCQ